MRSQSLIVSLFLCLLTLLIFSARASAQTTTWTFCANEGGTCSFTGTQQVRYGANGAYVYQTLTDGTACTNSVFGDPAYGTVKQCDVGAAASTSSWTFCATEGGFCSFAGTLHVRYGANGAYVYQTLTDGTPCTNSVFGDPAYGTAKQCEIGSAASTSSWTFCATEGGFCSFAGTLQVRYGANGAYVYQTLSNGTACTNSVFGDPASGTVKQCDIGGAASPPPPSPPASAVGPQSTITCPAGAVDIFPGSSIQGFVNQYPGATTFCLRSGVHYLTGSITPKTGNVFVGEYGAVLDGIGWATSDRTQGAFRANNQDIDYVTIRNLVIRNMPQRGVHFYTPADHWTIEYNEIGPNKDIGINFAPYTVIRNNYIHHNTFAGYYGDPADYSTLENNEIAYNGHDEKIGESANVTFRNNFVHHNVGMGIWFDWDNTGGLVEGNLVEDNGASGIQFEVSSDGIVRNNIVRRSGQNGLYISTSKNMQVYGNTFENNFRGIQFFINCAAIGQGKIGFDLLNVAASDNTITVGTQSGAWANLLSYSGDCTQTQLSLYLNGSKNLTFTHNTYRVPSLANWYWLWGNDVKYWNQWQAISQDATGTVSQY